MALTASKTASWTIAAKRACANGLSPWPMSVLTVSSFQVRTTSARAEVAAVITASATRTARILVTIQILPFLLRAPTPPPRPGVNEFRTGMMVFMTASLAPATDTVRRRPDEIGRAGESRSGSLPVFHLSDRVRHRLINSPEVGGTPQEALALLYLFASGAKVCRSA